MPRTGTVALLSLAAALSSGCIVHAHGHGHVGGGVYVEHGHHYVFYPGYRAYHCTVHDDWWCEDGGSWVRFTVRPAHIRLSADVHWVVIDDDDGPEPFSRIEHHLQKGDGPGRGKGPPPGRGWKKNK